MKKIFTLFLLLIVTFSFANYSANTELACPTVAISYPGSPFCSNISTPQTVSMTGTDNYTGGTFSSMPGLVINAATGAITPSLSTPGTYAVSYTIPAGGGCPSVSVTAMVNIAQTPIATIGSNQIICSGSTTMLTFTGTPNATVSYTINGGVSENITLNSSGNAMLPTTPLTSDTVYNLVSVSSVSGCSRPVSGSVTITVIPGPTMTTSPSSQTICSGETTMIMMNSSTPNATYQWNAVQAGVIGSSAGSGNIINQVLVTTGNSIGQVIYTITPTANGCSGSPMMVTITVMPIPIVMASPSIETINSGQATNIVLNSSAPGTTYSWTSTSSNVTGASAGSGNTISQILTLNNTGLSGSATYTIRPSMNGCYGNPIVVTVTVNPNLGTNDFDSQNFIVSPNPVTDILNIKNNQTINKVSAFNQLGQMVLQKEYNNNEVQLDFSGLKTGIYFITVDSDNKQSNFKIVKN